MKQCMQESIKEENASIFTPFVTLIEAGIVHFIFISILAIMCKLFFKIDNTYKKIIYCYPLFTFYFSIPVGMLAGGFANWLNVFGL